MNKLNPEALLELCNEVRGEKPVKKTITFNINNVDHTADIFIKQLSYEDTAAIDAAYIWEPDKEDPEELQFKGIEGKSLQAAHLLGSICIDEKGTKFFENVEHVLKTHPNVCRAMYAKADEVNNFWGKPTSEHSSKKKSGSSLHLTESVEEPLLNAKEILPTENLEDGFTIVEEGEP